MCGQVLCGSLRLLASSIIGYNGTADTYRPSEGLVVVPLKLTSTRLPRGVFCMSRHKQMNEMKI